MDNTKKSILLVEDEAIIAMVEKQELENYGYIVNHVTSGEAAIDAANCIDSNYDLILMDINLGSGIDGTQAAEEILKVKDIPVIFLSSHTELEVVEKTESITSYGYVVKNSGIIVLDASIKMALKLFDAKMKNKLAEGELVAAKEKAEENEQKYKQIFDNTLDIVLFCEVTEDNRYKVITFNPAEAKIIGSLELYQNKYVDECIPLELYHQFKLNCERCIKEGKRIEYEEEISFHSFNKSFNTQLIPLKNSLGRIYRIIVISKDITENKNLNQQITAQNENIKLLNYDLTIAKERAEENETKYRLIFDNVGETIFVAQDGKIKIANSNVEALTGYTLQEILSRPFIEFIHPDDRQWMIERHMARMSETSNAEMRYEFRLIHKSGETRILQISVSMTQWEGRPATINFLNDITERKREEENCW